jgi:hypothetical protein
MAADVRLIQVARILGLRPLGLTHDAARDAIAMRAPEMALAFFLEAADSDDVTGAASALDYLDGRIAFFRDLIAPAAAEVIRTAFREKLRSWG